MHSSMKRLLEVAKTDKKSKIAHDLCVGVSTVTNWVKRGVSKEGALAAADKYKTNANYILTGEASTPSVEQLKERIQAIENRPQPQNTEADAKENLVPVISWVAAGSFSDVDPVTIDDVIDWIPRPPHLSKRAFGLIIEGRSMFPEFKPAEIIYVEPEITTWDLKDGDLVVIHCDDDKQATFKQLMIGDGIEDMYLKPLNNDWPDQKIIPMGICSLVGVVDSKYVRYRK